MRSCSVVIRDADLERLDTTLEIRTDRCDEKAEDIFRKGGRYIQVPVLLR